MSLYLGLESVDPEREAQLIYRFDVPIFGSRSSPFPSLSLSLSLFLHNRNHQQSEPHSSHHILIIIIIKEKKRREKSCGGKHRIKCLSSSSDTVLHKV